MITLFCSPLFTSAGELRDIEHVSETQPTINTERRDPDKTTDREKQITPQEYWSVDPEFQKALDQQGKLAVFRNIRTELNKGASQLTSGEWDPTYEEALSLATAMRWAAIRGLKDNLSSLDAIAGAPLGKVEPTLHYALTYNGRWAAWIIRTRGQESKERIADLIATWRNSSGSLQSFAEDRLIEDPEATEALVTLTVKEILPLAGQFDGKTLIVEDVDAAIQLGRLETLLAAKAQRSDADRKIIKSRLAGTPLSQSIALDVDVE
jgi:hypothetical protein